MHQNRLEPFEIITNPLTNLIANIRSLANLLPINVKISDVVVLEIVGYLWIGEVDHQGDLVEQDELLILSEVMRTLEVWWSPTKKPSNNRNPPTDYISNVYYKLSNIKFYLYNNPIKKA